VRENAESDREPARSRVLIRTKPTNLHRPEGERMLLLLALLILILALGGGIFISKFLFILLLVAVIVALFSRRTV
jgi:hypothetical protein